LTRISSVKVADRLRQIVPEVSIGIAHGRLGETELEEVSSGSTA
jgi:transcription-repair coupling factor (superfamily II helicase)